MQIILSKDLAKFKGVKIRSAQKEMNLIKDFYDKAPHQLVTSLEVAEYYDVPEDFLIQIINA
ncbi:hypothetical protein [Psychroflexus sp. ALD_RP9]|uniref:hypothetical protein n=1 Tax=Psychroflexus sp. ALD_RP9 TaxID=2777186 RepID=UPI001A906F1C|nr:hypothetical protein [Psychroflexus sp. ALD_RP9]QSS98016.1 hypothetical protein IMZ30_04695 [Psychroflexus sp. ALD_RP9]